MNQVVIKVIGNYSYQTSRCLGEGVYGKVYEGMQRETKQKVAIKKIDLNTFTNDKYLQNAIFSQIYLLKRFSHPNIVRFKDVLSSKNSLYIITQFCKNGDLKQMIKRKRFKQQQAFDIMRQLLSGFNQLVREKIIHRDLKPANILISEGVYKIGDFGFAKYVDNFGSQLLKSCVGSPIYMAPQILQRTQYTTKCDIWSLGIIFYEMIHGYPPWKARDQNELLKTVKNVPITQVLKKSNLSLKCNQFLRKTLAYSQQQRISWNQLFQMFGSDTKQQKPQQQLSQQKPIQKKTRVLSTHTNSLNYNVPQSYKLQQKPSISSSNGYNSLNNLNNIGSSPSISHSPYSHSNTNILITPQRSKPNFYSTSNQLSIGSRTDPEFSNTSSNTNTNTNSNSTTTANTVTNSNGKRNAQIDNAIQWRQYLIYYHFYCIELLANFGYLSGIVSKIQIYGKLLFSLSCLVKSRSTFCLSMIVMHSKVNKNVDQLYKKMQIEHQSYEMAFNDVLALLDRLSLLKTIKSQYQSVVGHNEIISQDRMEKIQGFMVTIATENAQILSQQVKKKVKMITARDYPLVEVLDFVLDVLRLALGKSKSLRQIQDEQKDQDQEIKDYVARVFGKVDRLAANL